MVAIGLIAVSLLLTIVAFQLALALGAPFGRAAWGGKIEGVLPAPLRVASAITGIGIYPVIIAIVLSASGVVDADLVPGQGDVLMWVLAAFFGIGGVLNAASRSSLERWWAPVSFAVAACCAYLATRL